MIRKLALAAIAAAALSGCALLSTPDPVQLYRFGEAAAATGTPAAEPVQVKLRAVEFSQAAQGDRLLGLTGGSEAAYIAGARWVSPARRLYTDSIESAFAGQARTVRLIGRRELTPATRLLDLDVRTFETRYDYVDAVPTVVVTVRVRLLRFPERTVAAEQSFTVSQPAGANRISSIVEAYDVATRDVNSQIVAWTDANAGGA
ncbi:MAG: membrane integrity-associated transporter subunit PqiC [Alphaproteobacteria bacterium]|nr:membrane integrity-associated transporter subunit PqiC [Alphaproteobacteria bacterium]MBU2377624.1 membrane integrity-associated transporter subunit PqiC [Alphaproteobacteria bacterium]